MRQTIGTMSPPATAAEPPLPLAIRLLRRLNPLIARLLRSRLHGLFSRDLLLLTYVGARSGVARTLPLSYVESGGRLYLCTRSSLWWRNLRNGTPVELRLRGRRVTATPVVVDLRSTEALDALRAFLTANPKTGAMLYQVRRGPDGRPSEKDLRREVLRSCVQWWYVSISRHERIHDAGATWLFNTPSTAPNTNSRASRISTRTMLPSGA